MQPADRFSERVPPQNLEAEQSVLGACLLDAGARLKARTILKIEDFYAFKHQEIWKAIMRADDAGGVDLVTVQEQLRRPAGGDPNRTILDEVGGLEYMTTLLNTVPTTVNTEQYATIVAKKAELRFIQLIARKAADACYEVEDPEVVRGDLQQGIDKTGRSTTKKGLKSVAGRIGNYAEQRYQQRKLPNADWIPSRFRELREKCPFLRREVTLLAMPPNSGKTTVAVAEADFLSELGYETAIFELEMGEEQIYDKLIAQEARIPVKGIRMGLLTEPEWFLYRDVGQVINQRETLHINTETVETMANIRWQCLRLKAERGTLDMVMIDFSERVADELGPGERHDQLVARILGMAQIIARECNCHVIVLHQIDVKVLDRANPIPTKSDLANSKTNLSAWPDNIITGIQPVQAKGDGKIKPKIWGVECKEKCWKNTIVLNVAKGRFSEAGALVLVFAELVTGYLGALKRPWPWQKDADLEQVGQWDKEADEDHLKAMQAFRAQAMAVQVEELEELF